MWTESPYPVVILVLVNISGHSPSDLSRPPGTTHVHATIRQWFNRPVLSAMTTIARRVSPSTPRRQGGTGTPAIDCGTDRTAELTPALVVQEAVCRTSPRPCPVQWVGNSTYGSALTRWTRMKTSVLREWKCSFVKNSWPNISIELLSFSLPIFLRMLPFICIARCLSFSHKIFFLWNFSQLCLLFHFPRNLE